LKIAILPARGGSKRVKGKNIIDFLGKPMISYPLEAARNSGLFDKIHVSTDSEEIARVVEKLGFPVDFPRSKETADDHSPVMEVARFVLKEYEKRGQRFSSFALIMPCSPLLLAEDLVKSYKLFEQHQRQHPVLSVCEFPTPIEWAFEEQRDGTITVANPDLLLIRSQDLKKKFFDTGTFSIQNSEAILGSNAKVFKSFVPYVLPKERAVDIDSIEDLEFAKLLMRGRMASAL
jgi:N-acylneuraminate cytidylyltransferase